MQEGICMNECPNAEDAKFKEGSSAPLPASNSVFSNNSFTQSVWLLHDLLRSYAFGIVWQASHIAQRLEISLPHQKP